MDERRAGPGGRRDVRGRTAVDASGNGLLVPGRRAGTARSGAGLRRARRSLRHRVLAGLQGTGRLPHADGLGRGRRRRCRLVGDSPAAGPVLPLPAAHRPLAADRQERDPGSVLSVYRRMLAFRRNQAALRVGSIRFIDAPDGLLAFVRQHREEAWLCLFNFSGNPVRFDLPCAGADRTADPVRAPADGAAVHPFQPLPAAGSVTLEPLGVGLGPTWIRGLEADGPAASAGRRENASGVWHPPHPSR